TTPAAKLSADLLWKEFHADPKQARATYHGRAIELTGQADLPAEGVIPASLNFAQADGGRITAALLADRAKATVDAARATPRVTLRCFVEGAASPAEIVLRSCIV